MTTRLPTLEEPYLPGAVDPLPWHVAAERWASADQFWLATGRPDGRPHLVPVLAVWVEGTFHFVVGPASVKAGNLHRRASCAVATDAAGTHLVLEGEPTRLTDAAGLRAVAAAYTAKYQWSPTVRDGVLADTEGAPTAGPPPYHAYRLDPVVGFAFPAGSSFTPTRWRFDPSGTDAR